MKTREQLIDEVKSFDLWTDYNLDYDKLVMLMDMIIATCEEVVIGTDEGYQSEELGSVIQIDTLLENLKKLKS